MDRIENLLRNKGADTMQLARSPFSVLRSQWDSWIVFHKARALFEALTLAECEEWAKSHSEKIPETAVLLPRAPGIVPMGD